MIIKDNSLTPNAFQVIRAQATEKPDFSSENINNDGTYLCRACGLALFRVSMQFQSFCGWPSFDEIIENTVASQLDEDGVRAEIHCARCNGHLGHVFHGEGFTEKNIRYCVNSVSLDFVADSSVLDTEEAIVAAGCFWGVQYYFNKLDGVVKTEVGYIGGTYNSPNYNDVCTGQTGHYEGLRIVYDVAKIDFEAIIKYFFEIHDPTQKNGQGPDIGPQYQSAIFYYDMQQKNIAINISSILIEKGYSLATKLLPVNVFWKAEDYHQDYYSQNYKTPYCHKYVKRF